MDLFDLLNKFRTDIFDEPEIAVRRVLQTGDRLRRRTQLRIEEPDSQPADLTASRATAERKRTDRHRTLRQRSDRDERVREVEERHDLADVARAAHAAHEHQRLCGVADCRRNYPAAGARVCLDHRERIAAHVAHDQYISFRDAVAAQGQTGSVEDSASSRRSRARNDRVAATRREEETHSADRTTRASHSASRGRQESDHAGGEEPREQRDQVQSGTNDGHCFNSARS